MFVANSDAPTIGHVNWRPARKKPSLLPLVVARMPSHRPTSRLPTNVNPQTTVSREVSVS